MSHPPVKTILPAVFLALVPGVLHAASIGVNFGAGRPGASLSAATSAGIVPQVNWNNASGATGSLSTLTENSGSASPVSVSWLANEEWSIGGNASAESGGDGILLKGWISANNTTSNANVTFSGIPYAQYDLYIYINHDRLTEDVLLSGPFGSFQLQENDTDITAATPVTFVQQTASAGSSAQPSGNYVRFTGLSAADLVIGLAPGGAPAGNADRGPINAIQIVEVPEPGSLMLLGATLLGSLARRRRG